MPSAGKRRRLGQHFLSDPQILRRIVDALDPAPEDVVLEIGAGKGSLTRELLARGCRVVAIEKDRALVAANPELHLVAGDALRLEWATLVDHQRFQLIGNVPYAITSPLLDKALTPPLPERIVFLVQREVADRLAATPGSKTYGALTVGVQAVARVERLFGVRAGSFSPPPRVESAVVRLTPLKSPLVPLGRVADFRRFVVACFSQRRKQLKNTLAAAWRVTPSQAADRLRALSLDPTARPETLSPPEFVHVFTPPLDASP